MNPDEIRRILVRMQNDRELSHQHRNKIIQLINHHDERERLLRYFSKKYPHPYPDELD